MPKNSKTKNVSGVSQGVDDFLMAESAAMKAARCLTCKDPNRGLYEDAVRHFRGVRGSGVTAIPFRTFVLKHVRPKLGYKGQPESLKRHMEGCLGEAVE